MVVQQWIKAVVNKIVKFSKSEGAEFVIVNEAKGTLSHYIRIDDITVRVSDHPPARGKYGKSYDYTIHLPIDIRDAIKGNLVISDGDSIEDVLKEIKYNY